MKQHSTAIEALNHYGDMIYRIALLGAPSPAWAIAATEHAFTTLDWGALQRREGQVETEDLPSLLLAALPLPPRRLSKDARRAPLPVAFWSLPAAARRALALRSTQGYDVARLASILRRPADGVRYFLVDAYACLGGVDPGGVPETCRRSRALRLEQPGADALHLRFCEACRVDDHERPRVEALLGDALVRAVGLAALPPRGFERIRSALDRRWQVKWSRPLSWPRDTIRFASTWLMVTLVVSLIWSLVAPRVPPAAARQTIEPLALLRRALLVYSTPPTGAGVQHRRYIVPLGERGVTVEAETWTDLARPARHRMQLADGPRLLEWQQGDGKNSLVYRAPGFDRLCGANYAGAPMEADAVHYWSLPPAEQEAWRERRWLNGPWAAGRRYLEAALRADSVRSLGATAMDGGVVATVAAEGRGIDGMLLLKLDARSGELREVREVFGAGGRGASWTPWRLLLDERIAGAAALGDMPAPRQRTAAEPSPPVDPACPLAHGATTVSATRILGRGEPALLGFAQPPPEIERAYILGDQRTLNRLGPASTPRVATLVYAGPGKRLALTGLQTLRQDAGPPIAAGAWRVWLRRSGGPAVFEGEARAAPAAAAAPLPGFAFVADGWEQAALLELLKVVRPLTLLDESASRPILWDPERPPALVVDFATAALRALLPPPEGVRYLIVARELRDSPIVASLADPYHAPPRQEVTETWAQYRGGSLVRFRSDTRAVDGRLRLIEWGGQQSRWRFYPDGARLERSGKPALESDPSLRLQRTIENIFRYNQFEIGVDESVIPFEATVPISATDLAWGIQAQRRGAAEAWDWPWMADLQPRSAIYRATFSWSSRRLLGYEVAVAGPTGSTRVEQLSVQQFDTNATVPEQVWQPPLPAVLPPLDVENSADAVRRDATLDATLDAALAWSKTPLWGWAPGQGLRFAAARTPAAGMEVPVGPRSLRAAVAAGVAVELRYDAGAGTELRLYEGPRSRFGALLRETPPAWVASHQRTIPVAGVPQTVWIMDDGARERWVIFERGETLVVANTDAPQLVDAFLPMLARLVSLSDERR